MARPDHTELYRRLEIGLAELLRSTRSHLSSSDAELAQHYLDHGEYGLALEALASGLVAAGVALPSSTLALVRELLAAMGGESEVSVDLAALAGLR